LLFIMFYISCILLIVPSYAQFIPPAPVYTIQNVTVNRTLPKDILAADQPLVVRFSANPTDDEIYRVHFFEEPLVPIKNGNDELADNTVENRDLVSALAKFTNRPSADDFIAITDFLNTHPHSRWRGALLTNLGIVYRRTGYFTLARDSWKQAWELMKNENDPKIKVLADRAMSELLLIYCWVGEYEKTEARLKEMDERVMEGPASGRIVGIRSASWTMKNHPEQSFMCGPYALIQLLSKKDSTISVIEKLRGAQSPRSGFSLDEVQKMAHDAGLDYQMAFRKPGSAIILNSVVHWKLNHYSALLKNENGYYGCEDATMNAYYGQQFWLTSAAFDDEASGYFLVPNGTLPKGWRKVNTGEASRVFGKGMAPPPNDKYRCPNGPENECNGGGMARCDVNLINIGLHIYDKPVYYNTARGPAMMWKVDYRQKDDYQPANFNYSNLGPKWTFEWLSFVIDDPTNPLANADVYLPGGGVQTFVAFNTNTQSFAPELHSDDVLVRISGDCYEVHHADGSKDVYSRPNGSTVAGRKVFMTQKVDAAGNAMSVLYDDVNLKIVALEDALGQVTTISYNHPTDIYKITKVTDPFGRFATFDYDSLGRLNGITDMIGMVSSFKYDEGDFISQMATPYGTTRFIKADGPGNFRSLEINYPLGEKEMVQYMDDAAGIPGVDATVPAGMDLLFNGNLNYRNTFVWDKKAMAEAPGDYTKARIYHWLHGGLGSSESGFATPILESMKDPLENRVWYCYQGQTEARYAKQGMSSSPSNIGRVLDDGSTQLTKYTYNALGAMTSSTDPLPFGRQLTYIYDANLIDLLEVRMTTGGANELLEKHTYNEQHLPLTSTDASGQTIIFTYNAAGQLLTSTNPKHETTTRSYDANGYLQSITGPVNGSTLSFTYDGFGRVRTVTDPQGYIVTTDYDALDRPTVITYPDGTFEQTVYDRLDAVHTRDRLGRWSHTTYDSVGRATIIQDALGRITQQIWCSCGSLEQIVDPLKQITAFTYDVQGRITAKTYNDGKAMSYTYETTTSHLKEITDPKGQKTQYQYFTDGNLKQVDYVNAVIATPSVSYTYDPHFNRVATMSDGTGTTTYTYNPITTTPTLGAGELASIDGPLSNDIISYTYDSLGRIITRSINNVAATSVFDALGRVKSATNSLGTFAYSYVNQTDRISGINLPNGQTASFDYFDNLGDQRLKQILNKKSDGSTLSKFDYEYDDEGQITKWTQKAGSAAAKYYELQYDLADQLIAATLRNQSNATIVKRYNYRYDKAGNRTSEQVDNSINSFVHNNVNQLTSQSEGGPYKLKGTMDEFSAVIASSETTITSDTATVDTNNVFEASVKVIPGSNVVDIAATDYSGNNNQKTIKYQFTVSAGENKTLTYDNNGNTLSVTSSSPTVTYDWDAADRLVKITKGDTITEFVYDGLSRRVAEKLNGSVIKRWLWCNKELCEERDATGGTVTKRFFQQGQQNGTTKYYYTRDHLGSIREMVTSNGNTIKARYDYDPYGRRGANSITSNPVEADFGFTGHYYHQATGLHLALYRAYDANLGRWLNRDPIGETGGLNLYEYVVNNPVNKNRSMGTCLGA
jgi:RHS repeat-associated protein